MAATARDILRFDPALDPGRFAALLRAVRAVGNERLKTTYQTTFWYDLGAPACLPEAVAQALREHVPGGKRVVGVEWWLSRMRTTDVRVDFHRDRDERLALRTGKLVHPRWSSVLFLNRCRGGLLAITDARPNPDNPSDAPDRLDFDLVAPSPNRFVLFDGRLTHGVLDANNQIPDRRLPGKPPLRLTVIFNWWHRRPEGVPTWSEAGVYRALSLSPARGARSPARPSRAPSRGTRRAGRA
jgi:hypothetical protein